mmetsp:Transcript_118050/g.220616  ORF Transcript_118050/g.220616 Transcript_118050/m.220616 type:complete len:152 (+) Transcript_118050:4477-4932(+)
MGPAEAEEVGGSLPRESFKEAAGDCRLVAGEAALVASGLDGLESFESGLASGLDGLESFESGLEIGGRADHPSHDATPQPPGAALLSGLSSRRSTPAPVLMPDPCWLSTGWVSRSTGRLPGKTALLDGDERPTRISLSSGSSALREICSLK